MTFLNQMMLIGLAAVAIPIAIHLIHRGRAKVVNWGAMQFLLASLASRNRRILLEELTLLAVRCLCLALLALAMARPFLPVSSTVPWALVLPAILAAALCLAVATAMWSRRAVRWGFVLAAIVLVALAAGGSVWERYSQQRKWTTSAGQQDIAIVIDASMSMGLEAGGRTNLARAIDQARAIVESARVGDAISVILAGPTPQSIVPTPLADRSAVQAALDKVSRPANGSAGMLEAINAAVASLAAGNNSAKSIVVITDLQNIGWGMRQPDRWRYLAAGLKILVRQPRIMVRSLEMPTEYRNAAIASIDLSRKVVGSDREVTIDVKVINSGTTRLGEAGITVAIDGIELPASLCGAISPNSAETVSFSHRFATPGPHVVQATLSSADDLPGDNVLHRVVNVADRLPVLIVDGSPSSIPLEGAADFIEIALSPRQRSTRHGSLGADQDNSYLVDPTVVAAADISSISSFEGYRLIVLANVARLPRTAAARIARRVHRGAGLLVAPGNLARPEFYNGWKDSTGVAVMPATLDKRVNCAAKPVALAPRTFNHPCLQRVADPAFTSGSMIKSYWSLGMEAKSVSASLGAHLLNGAAFLAERRLGQGHVITTCVSLGRRDSNLHTLKAFFVPFLHEMTYFLAAGMMADANVPAGSEIVLELPLRPRADVTGVAIGGDPLAVTTPSAKRSSAWIAGASADTLRVNFSNTDEPGLYQLAIGPELSGLLSEHVAGRESWPFVVEGSALEGRLIALTSEELALPARYGAELLHAHSPEELAVILRGNMPGDELWRLLALAALAALLVEVFLTRWIVIQRKSGSETVVRFTHASEGVPLSPRQR